MYGLASCQIYLAIFAFLLEDEEEHLTIFGACMLYAAACSLPFFYIKYNAEKIEWRIHVYTTAIIGFLAMHRGFLCSQTIARYHAMAIMFGICIAQFARWNIGEQFRAEEKRKRRAEETSRRNDQFWNSLFAVGLATYDAFQKNKRHSKQRQKRNMTRSNSAPNLTHVS